MHYIKIDSLNGSIFQYLHFRINRYMVYKSIREVKVLDTASMRHNHILELHPSI